MLRPGRRARGSVTARSSGRPGHRSISRPRVGWRQMGGPPDLSGQSADLPPSRTRGFATGSSLSSARASSGTTRSSNGGGCSRSCSARSFWCSSPPGEGSWSGEGQIGLAAAVVAPGLMVMAIILFMGAVSGAHLNPAVSSPSPCAGTSPGVVCRATSSSSWSARPWPACSCSRSSATSSTSARRFRVRASGLAGVADGDRADRGLVSVILGPRRPRRTSARSRRSASAATSRWPGSGQRRSAAPR